MNINKDWFKDLGNNVMKRMINSMFAAAFTSRVENLTPEALLKAIERDDYDILAQANNKVERDTALKLGWAMKDKLDVLTPQNIILWLRESGRTDLVDILMNYKDESKDGIDYLEKMINNFKEQVYQYGQRNPKITTQ